MRRISGGLLAAGIAAAASGTPVLAAPSPVGPRSAEAMLPSAAAHEIPATVTVHTFVRVEDGSLRMLIRVPLGSMRDIEFPQRGPGYLEIAAADSLLREAADLWIVDYLQVFEEGELLPRPELAGLRISLPSNRSFSSFDAALAQIRSTPLPESTELVWQQAMLDVALEVPVGSDESRFALHSELAHLGVRTTTILRFELPDTEERLIQFTGDPGVVELDPRWYQAALSFVGLGFFHILDGIDHLLFLLCLILPFRRILPLVTLVTSFTVAHSITLGAAALGYAPSALWFPPLVETLIALSIVLMAIENIFGAKLQRRWFVAFGFGLVHGFGFSFALSESLQFAGRHLATSLLAFNVGVELGQILVVLVAAPAIAYFFRRKEVERMGIILVSAFVLHTGWHWTTDRWTALREFPLQWPTFDVVFALGVVTWVMGALIVIAVAWLMHLGFERLMAVAGARSEAQAES